MTHAWSRSLPLLCSLAMACSESPTATLLDATGAPTSARSSSALAALSEGMQAAAQRVEIWSDSRTALKASVGEESYVSSIDLVNTGAAADAGACTIKNNGADLKAFLIDAARGRNLAFEYDKTAATSDKHHLGVNFLQDGVRIRVRLKGNIEGFPKLTVMASDLGGGTTRYTFSGGAVNVERLVGGGVKQMDELFCDNQDVVHVDVTR